MQRVIHSENSIYACLNNPFWGDMDNKFCFCLSNEGWALPTYLCGYGIVYLFNISLQQV